MTAQALAQRPKIYGSIKRVLSALERYHKILITAHMRPDGDATGSSIAMARLLQAHGWAPTVSLSPIGMGPPKFLLDYATCIAPTNIKVKDYEAVLVLDCGGSERLPDGPLRDATHKLPVICIDHHVVADKKPFGIARWIDTTASSTGELVYQFAKRLKWEIDLHTAEALWVAIVTDTGRYAYSCTKPSTLKAGADLLACGIDASAINDRLFLYASEGAVLLKRKAYDSLTTWFRGKVALICLTARDFKRAGVAKSEIEDAIDIPRSIPTAKISLFFYETKDKRGVTRLSIRTRGEDEHYSSASIANHFGGGGHLRAAGCEIALPPKQAIEQVKAYLSDLLDT
jgi:phosphoesterase RecJ-like protein